MYFVYLPDTDGIIVSKLSSQEADDLIALDSSYSKIECPSDQETVKYIKVIDGICIAETQADIDYELFVALRKSRNEILASCDWTQANDSPLSASKRTEWATYRQALRDLPSITSDPANPVWPTPPQ